MVKYAKHCLGTVFVNRRNILTWSEWSAIALNVRLHVGDYCYKSNKDMLSRPFYVLFRWGKTKNLFSAYDDGHLLLFWLKKIDCYHVIAKDFAITWLMTIYNDLRGGAQPHNRKKSFKCFINWNKKMELRNENSDIFPTTPIYTITYTVSTPKCPSIRLLRYIDMPIIIGFL
jgi:hypothetical protein